MQHPDEGTIHAWLDGALPAEEGRALEAHVAGCAQCAAAVSEARGLLAASSRILSALDSVPGGVLPAAAPADIGDASVRTVRRSSLWRSPGWRAAAAIVLVGTVSWLATRSSGPASVATERAMSTAPAAAAGAGSLNDTSMLPVVVHAPPAASSIAPQAQRRVAAPRPEPGLARVQRNEAPRQVADAFGTSPTATAAAAGAVARMGAEQRLAAPSPSAAMSEVMPPMAKGIAPTRAIDAVERLAGCYALAADWTVSTEPGQAAAALLPARIELTRDRDASPNPATLVLRPAPGERAFATGTRGEWRALGGNTVELQIREAATRRVSAILSIAGDSVSGEARAYAADSTVPLVTAVKGQRIACPAR